MAVSAAHIAAFNTTAMQDREAGRLEKAVDTLHSALRIARENLGDDHVETLATINNLGATFQQMGRLELA